MDNTVFMELEERLADARRNVSVMQQCVDAEVKRRAQVARDVPLLALRTALRSSGRTCEWAQLSGYVRISSPGIDDGCEFMLDKGFGVLVQELVRGHKSQGVEYV